jgi:5-methyltetrahydropteroyltriglutamate--homocysteine methyltransferase
MQYNTDRILTTHVGSLPRPDRLLETMAAMQQYDSPKPANYQEQCAEAVNDIVRKQVESGIDVISDGEMSKVSYIGYVSDRLRGISVQPTNALRDSASSVLPTNITFPDIAEHPDYAEYRAKQAGVYTSGPVCVGQVAYGDAAPLNADIARLKAAAKSTPAQKLFMNAASPGVLAMFIPTTHYKTEEAYIADLAQAMKSEYEMIHKSGILLQIDCPDLAMSWHMRHWSKGEKEFLKIARRNLDAVNEATANIPAEAMRLHICWGNYPGPHTHDFPVSSLFEVLRHARAQSILFEGANPRHDHEWEDWQNARLPDDKVLIPGLIDSTANIVEHPRLVAQRIKRYTTIVGRERVVAGTDCGFGTFALRQHQVFPSVVWSKLKALSEGARIASDELWAR